MLQISSNTWVANPVGSCREVETWAWSEQSAMGRWLAPLKHPFLDGLPDLSGHCRFITLVWKDCGSFDVSTANGNWLVGQLLPHYVTSSHSYLCCSVWCSMCSHPSPPHTHAFGKVPISLQEHKCSKVAWFLPNGTFNFQQDSSKVVGLFQSIRFYTGLSASGHYEPAGTETRKAAKVVFEDLWLNFQVLQQWPFGWRTTFLWL